MTQVSINICILLRIKCEVGRWVCMLIAEKKIIENEYRRIDMEIYDLFPRRFGDVSFR